jgi:hypothetical protein
MPQAAIDVKNRSIVSRLTAAAHKTLPARAVKEIRRKIHTYHRVYFARKTQGRQIAGMDHGKILGLNQFPTGPGCDRPIPTLTPALA